MLSKLMQLMPGSGQELSTFVLEEIENDEKLQGKLNDSTTSERERESINHANSELKKLIISEEKISRLLFANILNWFQEERKERVEAEAKAAAIAALQEEDQKSSAALTAEGLRKLSVDSLNKTQDIDEISNISNDTAIKSSVAGDSVASSSKKKRKVSMTGSSAEPVPFEKVLEYMTLARERFVLDQKYFAKLAEEEKLMQMAAKRQRRMNQMDDARKMMLEFSRDVNRKKKEEDAAREQERKEREERGEDEGSLKSVSEASTDTSVTNSQTASTESISIAKLKRNRFMFMKKEVARFTEKEMEIFPDLYWFKLTIQHAEFFECFKIFPLMKEGLCTRDELVLFAKLCVELSPYTLKAKDRLKKKRDEMLNKKALRNKRFRENPTTTFTKPAELNTEEEAAIKAKEEYRRLLADGLAEEAEKRKKRLKAAKKRRKRREKAWLYAHQHMFIKLDGKPAYCVVCRDKMDTQWLDGQESLENKWNGNWDVTLGNLLNKYQFTAKQLVEDDYMKELAAKKSSLAGSGSKSSASGLMSKSSTISLPGAAGLSDLEPPPSKEGDYSDTDSSKSDCDDEGGNANEKDDKKVVNKLTPKSVEENKDETDAAKKSNKSTARSEQEGGGGGDGKESDKNNTPSNSLRKGFLRGLSSRFSKSFSGRLSTEDNEKQDGESESNKSRKSSNASVHEYTDKDAGDDKDDKDINDDLSRVSESKSEVSLESSNGGGTVGPGGGSSVVSGKTQATNTSATDEVFFAGVDEAEVAGVHWTFSRRQKQM